MTPIRQDTKPGTARIASLVRLDHASETVAVDGLSRPVPRSPGEIAELAILLYVRLHAGNPEAFSADAILPDPRLAARISAAVRDDGVAVAASPTSRPSLTAPAGVRLVDIQRVVVAVNDKDIAASDDGREIVRVPCSRPNLSPGFRMYVCEPATADPASGMPGRVTRLYVRHRDPDLAVDDWAACIAALTEDGVAFRTKILSRQAAYPRNDALVFYASTDADRMTQVVHDAVVRDDCQGSPFTVHLGNGVHAADDPRDPRLRHHGRSFGEHRCHLLAAAIAAATPDRSVEECLRDECRAAQVDPDDMSRNLTGLAMTTEAP